MTRFVFCWLFLVALFVTVLTVMGADPTESLFPKVVVLGIAQDGGIPQIGCTQKTCLTQHHFVSPRAALNAFTTSACTHSPIVRPAFEHDDNAK